MSFNDRLGAEAPIEKGSLISAIDKLEQHAKEALDLLISIECRLEPAMSPAPPTQLTKDPMQDAAGSCGLVSHLSSVTGIVDQTIYRATSILKRLQL
jgi:hypothetical protein